MTPPIDIRADHLCIVQDVLHRHLPDGVKVWVFGSRASWATKDSSDLDLALDGETEISPRSLTALEAAFEDSDLPYAVDIVDLKRINERFRRIVQQQRVALPENGSSRSTDWGSAGFGICPDWREMPFTEAFLVNPPTKIERGSSCAFVEMATVDPSFRSVCASKVREFRGGGSRFRDGDTLMARITPCLENGKIARYCADSTSEPAHGSTEFIVVRGCPGTTDTEFAYYVTRSSFVRDYAIGQMTGTSGRQRVPTESLEHLTIAVPPIPEQQAIAHILGTLDDKIELNRLMNATLEAMARALFRSWFVDFDPVRAKMEGRDTWLPKDIADLFPDRLVDSELGDIPQGWLVRTLGELCHKPQYGYTASARSQPVGPRFLRITDINKNPWVSWSRVPHCEATDDELSKYRLRKGDVLIARMADPGHGILVEEDVEAVFASYLIRFRPIENRDARFLQYWLKSDAYWQLVRGQAAGTTRVSLNAKVLGLFPLVVPPNGVASAFARVVGALRDRLMLSATEMQLLADLRDTLLPKLVSGQLLVQRNRTGMRA